MKPSARHIIPRICRVIASIRTVAHETCAERYINLAMKRYDWSNYFDPHRPDAYPIIDWFKHSFDVNNKWIEIKYV